MGLTQSDSPSGLVMRQPGHKPGQAKKEERKMAVLVYGTQGHVSFPFEGSAGLTRGTVKVEFTGLPDSFRAGEVLPGTASLRTAGQTAILE